MNSVESNHHKILAKVNASRDLINYVRFIVKKFSTHKGVNMKKQIAFCEYMHSELNQCDITNESNVITYEGCALHCLVDHYKSSSREESQQIFENYQMQVCSNNIVDDIDTNFKRVKSCIDKISIFKGFNSFLKHNPRINSELCSSEEPHVASTTSVYSEALVTDVQVDDFLLFLQNQQIHVCVSPAIEFITVRNAILAKLDFREACARIAAFFDEQTIVFVSTRNNPDVCRNCGHTMTLCIEDAELRCDKCNLILLLQGTAYDDSQPENQNTQSSKNKRYDPRRHCDKRLNQIQAKEEWKIPELVLSKLDILARREYRHGNDLRSMKSMPCTQIRRWLKQERLTKYNHHAPLIRKYITGLHGSPVIPPQLSPDEEQEILVDFSTAMSCYEIVTQTEEYKKKYEKDRGRIRQRNKPNRFYYWFVLFKILSQKYRKDSRLPRLLECIHLQSDTTLAKDDDIWAMMCKYPEMKGYTAEITNRALAQVID
jgi:hypothetical protein